MQSKTKSAQIENAELSVVESKNGKIVSLTVGGCYVTLWMDEKYARMVCVHNANDDKNGKVLINDCPNKPDSIIWLMRRDMPKTPKPEDFLEDN